ncbi:MAG TPA: hypothetical protein VKA60_05610 [Blastocatellia bacterium]|nr:hypothetical protein [Blastocatellia bacterium]
MIKKRIFQSLIVLSLLALQAVLAQAQSNQARGGWPRVNSQSPDAAGQTAPEPILQRQSGQTGEPDYSTSAKKPTLVGSWLVTVSIPGNDPPFDSFKALWALTGDGLLVASAQGDVAPTPFPSNSTAYGAWAETGRRQFAATFRSILYDAVTGENMGQFKLQQAITLSDSGDEWSGPFKLTVTDPAGNVIAVVSGTQQATRIIVEPL